MSYNFSEALGSSPIKTSAEDYYSYVKGLYIKPVTKTSSSIEGVSISFGERTIVRNSRKPKYVTRKEIEILAKEYSKKITEIWNLMRLRKIEIRN